MKRLVGGVRRKGRVLALLAWGNPLLDGGLYIPPVTASQVPMVVTRTPPLQGPFHHDVERFW